MLLKHAFFWRLGRFNKNKINDTLRLQRISTRPSIEFRPPYLVPQENELPVLKSEFIQFKTAATTIPEKFPIHETWLRHYCKCDTCFVRDTHERKVDPSQDWLKAKINYIFQDGEYLNVTWSDGHKSKFNITSLLEDLPSSNESSQINLNQDVILLPPKTSFLKDPFSGVVTCHNVLDSSSNGLRILLERLVKTGYGIVSQVSGLEETCAVHDRISHRVRTMYGDGVTVLEPDGTQNDAAYSTVALPLHTDTSYFTEPMGLQSFHMLGRSGVIGGLNCFSDGFSAAQQLYQESPELFRILANTQLDFHYLEPGRYDLQSIGPTLKVHNGILVQVRYNPRHVSRVKYLSMKRIPIFYEAFIRFTEILNEHIHWIQLEPGMILFVDNWRILHGRSGFTGKRTVASAYFPRSDWISKARVMGIEF